MISTSKCFETSFSWILSAAEYLQNIRFFIFVFIDSKDKKSGTEIDGKSSLEMVIFRDLDVVLRGSFKIIFYDKDVLSSDDKMCWCWFHSAIVARQKHVVLPKDEVDGAVKDKAAKHFTSDFGVEFWFDSPVDVDEEAMSPLNDWIYTQNRGHNRNQDSLDMMKLHLRDIRSQNGRNSKRRENKRPSMRKVHSNELAKAKVFSSFSA